MFSTAILQSNDDDEVQPHTHDVGQFTFISRGVVNLQAAHERWVLPESKLVWIPPGVLHSRHSYGSLRGWLVRVGVDYVRYLPKNISVLAASSLLLAALERIAVLQDADLRFLQLLADLVLAEVKETDILDFRIPLPRSPHLQTWALDFCSHPTINTTVRMAAVATKTSSRSFTRHFFKETGKTFSEWKRSVVIQRAIKRLAEGANVSEVAYETGYQDSSSFIAMFKAAMGRSPKQFISSAQTAGELRRVNNTPDLL